MLNVKIVKINELSTIAVCGKVIDFPTVFELFYPHKRLVCGKLCKTLKT